ncbi:hypothetical protein [Pseudoclavibacter terrae]|uniref:Uncharacterized protein n=1 Tax=Pseudoclavibacter terrae TaxID=1530195 RepID=A0A7J5B6C3_9MICO|nr:hypothetical protein [Pseudoclavibacter terrae]KAB1639702.1 hypothetical protein F8O03_05115 [Pseudoclavibacter terrae]
MYTRGDEFTLTADTVAKSVNRLGESLLASFLSDDAQLAAWGEVRFAAGPRPEDFQQLLAGSTAWKLAKQAALARAGRYPYGTKLRDDAMREVEAQFGPGDIATGGQTNSHGGQVTP